MVASYPVSATEGTRGGEEKSKGKNQEEEQEGLSLEIETRNFLNLGPETLDLGLFMTT